MSEKAVLDQYKVFIAKDEPRFLEFMPDTTEQMSNVLDLLWEDTEGMKRRPDFDTCLHICRITNTRARLVFPGGAYAGHIFEDGSVSEVD